MGELVFGRLAEGHNGHARRGARGLGCIILLYSLCNPAASFPNVHLRLSIAYADQQLVTDYLNESYRAIVGGQHPTLSAPRTPAFTSYIRIRKYEYSSHGLVPMYRNYYVKPFSYYTATPVEDDGASNELNYPHLTCTVEIHINNGSHDLYADVTHDRVIGQNGLYRIQAPDILGSAAYRAPLLYTYGHADTGSHTVSLDCSWVNIRFDNTARFDMYKALFRRKAGLLIRGEYNISNIWVFGCRDRVAGE